MDTNRITKYQHACFIVSKAGKSVIVDPGEWSDDFASPQGVVAVIITHEHADHCDAAKLAEITSDNPDVTIFAHPSVVAQLGDLPTQAVIVGEVVTTGGFSLQFVGGEHARIDSSIPAIANLGVIIDNDLYYPGDSFAVPETPIKTLALPVSAPWMKLSEAADFVRAVKPETVFPTHDAILSDKGKQLVDRMLGAICQQLGATYTRL